MVMNTQLLFIKSHQYILLHNSWLAIFKSSQRGPHGILQFTHGNVDKSNKTFISRWFRGKALVQIATTCANDSKVLMYLHGYIGILSISSHHLSSKNVACHCTLVASSRRLPVQSSNLSSDMPVSSQTWIRNTNQYKPWNQHTSVTDSISWTDCNR